MEKKEKILFESFFFLSLPEILVFHLQKKNEQLRRASPPWLVLRETEKKCMTASWDCEDTGDRQRGKKTRIQTPWHFFLRPEESHEEEEEEEELICVLCCLLPEKKSNFTSKKKSVIMQISCKVRFKRAAINIYGWVRGKIPLRREKWWENSGKGQLFTHFNCITLLLLAFESV